MPSFTEPSFEDQLMKTIEKFIRQQMNEAFDEEKARLIEQLEMKRDSIVSAAALNITRYMDIDTMRDRILITIRKDLE